MAIPKALQRDIEELLVKAKQRGFVTQDEVMDVFVEPELYLDELDAFYDQVLSQGIDIFESVSEENQTDDSDSLQRELDVLSSLDTEGVSDPVRMYLKEIGRIPH